MISNIKKILSSMNNIDGWKINQENTNSSELFFIKQELDMNRCKNVNHFKVTVYKNFEENDNKYTGSSTTIISPGMNEDEISDKLNDAAFAASFIKNKYYPLPMPSNTKPSEVTSKFSKTSISDSLPGLIEAIFESDNKDNGSLNSVELFLDKKTNRVLNSNEIDATYTTYNGFIEFITNWKEDGEEIELYRDISFSDYNPEYIKHEVEHMLNMSREKAIASPTPSIKNCTVILTGKPVKTLLKYYCMQASAQSVYDQISTATLNENIQGENVKGDLITLKLDPSMKNSSKSKPYDNDGIALKEVTLFESGILKNYWGNQQYSSYLDIKTTGEISNFVVECGNTSIEDFKKKPHIELLAFSDFQINPLTGDFGGEIRLGRYFDGENIIPVTSGSISCNIKDIHKEMYFSKELQQDNEFVGPKSIQMFNIDINGN